MPWLELTIKVNAATRSLIEDILELSGAQAITLKDAGDENLIGEQLDATPLWNQAWLTALFTADTDLQLILALLTETLGTSLNYSIQSLADQSWENSWKQYFSPMCFAKNFWILPTDTPAPNHLPYLYLDPGLAFGTGSHPSTAFCLNQLASTPPKDQLVLDYGCGSGILALAALKLGAKKAFAIDHDPQALEATRLNAIKNNLSLAQLAILSPAELPSDFKYSVILANIVCNTLIELKPLFTNLLGPEGRLILAGILTGQVSLIRASYEENFVLTQIETQEDWAGIVLSPKFK